jgi:iron(III) transport system substrate-binding protein
MNRHAPSLFGALSMALLAAGAAQAQAPVDRDALIKAAKAEGKLMLYSSSGETQSRTVLGAFEQEYGIKGSWLRLTTIPLIQRLSAEIEGKDAQADVVSVSTTVPFVEHPDWFVAMTKDYAPNVDKWPKRWTSKNYVSWSADSFYMAYNTDQVPVGSQPKTYEDLTNPKWKGKILLTDPRVADNYFGWLDGLEKVKGAEYLRKVASLELKLTQSGASGAQMIAAGAYAINFPTFPDFSTALIEKKAPIALFAVTDPALISERVIAAVTAAPHPNAARLFMDWVMSDNGVRAACKNGSVSIVADSADKLGCPGVKDVQSVSYMLTEERKKQLVREFGLGN